MVVDVYKNIGGKLVFIGVIETDCFSKTNMLNTINWKVNYNGKKPRYFHSDFGSDIYVSSGFCFYNPISMVYHYVRKNGNWASGTYDAVSAIAATEKITYADPNVVCRFEKVPLEVFKSDWDKYCEENYSDSVLDDLYTKIKLPVRYSIHSPNYVLYFPGLKTDIRVGHALTVPTGIKCVFLKDGYDLQFSSSNTFLKDDKDVREIINKDHIMLRILLSPTDLSNYNFAIDTGDSFAHATIRSFFLADTTVETTEDKE